MREREGEKEGEEEGGREREGEGDGVKTGTREINLMLLCIHGTHLIYQLLINTQSDQNTK
jgi:hypothetical protein